MPEKFWKRLKDYTGKIKVTRTAPEERLDYLTLEKRYGCLVDQWNEATRAVRSNGSHPDNLNKLIQVKNDYLSLVSAMDKILGKEEAAKIRASPKYTINDSLD